jgi:dTDP-4-dehydrorhamnose 3,5-epimerase
MSAPLAISIKDCAVLPVTVNSDARGCLYEIFRESWPHSFRAVQWNSCVSNSGALRGVHVHIDYDEFYTLPLGRVLVGLHDIRRSSPTFGQSVQFEWFHQDACAIVIPKGVAHVLYFFEDSVLAFGLSSPWRSEYAMVGCEWDDPELGFDLPIESPIRSARDSTSGSYHGMILGFEELTRQWQAEQCPLVAY